MTMINDNFIIPTTQEGLIDMINDSHGEIERLSQTALDYADRIGGALLTLQSQMDVYEFAQLCRDKIDVKERQRKTYMWVARHGEHLPLFKTKAIDVQENGPTAPWEEDFTYSISGFKNFVATKGLHDKMSVSRQSRTAKRKEKSDRSPEAIEAEANKLADQRAIQDEKDRLNQEQDTYGRQRWPKLKMGRWLLRRYSTEGQVSGIIAYQAKIDYIGWSGSKMDGWLMGLAGHGYPTSEADELVKLISLRSDRL